MRGLLALLLWCLVPWGVFAAPADTEAKVVADTVREVYLSSWDAVGDKFRIDARVDRRMQVNILAPGQQPKQDTMKTTLIFSALITVHEVNKRGGVTRATVRIDSMFSHDPDIPVPMEVIESGTLFEARAEGGKTVYRIGGRALTETHTEELRLFVSLDAEEMSQNEVFGSKVPRKLGETWELDPYKVAALFKDQGTIHPGRIRAASTLTAMPVIDSVRHMTVSSTVSANGIDMARSAGIIPTGGTFFFANTLTKPVDRMVKGRLNSTARLRVSMTFTAPLDAGNAATGNQVMEVFQQSVVTPVN